MAERNWAGNHHYRADRLHHPRSVDELAGIVASSSAVHILGSRHSFNDIADTEGDLISVTGLPADIAIDTEARTVSVGGGVTYGQLAPVLQAAGWALPNLASLPHISVAGAVVTGTHGSGNRNGGLATAVSGIEILTGDGEIIELDRGTGGFRGAVVNLGAFGAVVRLTLDLETTFDVRQFGFEGLTFDDLIDSFESVSDTGYSVSVFTDWSGDTVFTLVKTRAPATPEVPGATPARSDMPNFTPQQGVPGAWCDRLPHFALEVTPSVGAELQTEYLIGREHAPAAIRALRAMASDLTPLLYVTEIRTVAASDLWLDPAYRRDSVALHFTWKPDLQAVTAVLPAIEAALAAHAPRPHWGKLFSIGAAELADRYEKLADFRAMAEYFDPRGVFRNDYLRRTVWAG